MTSFLVLEKPLRKILEPFRRLHLLCWFTFGKHYSLFNTTRVFSKTFSVRNPNNCVQLDKFTNLALFLKAPREILVMKTPKLLMKNHLLFEIQCFNQAPLTLLKYFLLHWKIQYFRHCWLWCSLEDRDGKFPPQCPFNCG